VASISVPEPRSLMIKPFDATVLKDIEKAILASDLGLTPNSDGKVIHLNLPPLTEERRRDLVKLVHSRLEDSRVAIRNIRRDSHNDMRDFEKEKLISEDDRRPAKKACKNSPTGLSKMWRNLERRRNSRSWKCRRSRTDA
jgi:ribosome recycling factor